ncbi:NAD(P)-binding protein [Myriangium duriaei CBS 260.36]|uniref:NAD(P)-binding protein n=1 Tax=Myriangium duriaei CBS 260.36 TaxID=1168546 RepID=A0A9P4J195_9PEZI|nr:NAD(P)-binding protein [Myriangium duriaei CBS 260.36]
MRPKTAVISGGARGIGRCIVRRFLERGYRVYVLDIDEDELVHTVTKHLQQYHSEGMIDFAICDLRSSDDIRSKIKKAAIFLGNHIDVLVNNGGIATPYWADGKTMADFDTLGQWQAYLETNLTAPFVASQACLPYMKQHESTDTLHADNSDAGPCIIHIGSFRAEMSDPRQEGYSSSKAGLVGLMHSMAMSLQQWGIRVNLVAPGRIKVAHESKDGDEKGMSWSEQNESKDINDHATNRAGRPKDIADAVEYLVNAGFVTAQAITVDGGATKQK